MLVGLMTDYTVLIRCLEIRVDVIDVLYAVLMPDDIVLIRCIEIRVDDCIDMLLIY